MKEKYSTPECEAVMLRPEGIIAASENIDDLEDGGKLW